MDSMKGAFQGAGRRSLLTKSAGLSKTPHPSLAKETPMCGRYSITTPPDALRRLLFDFDDLPNLAPRYNLAPTQAAPVVRA